MSNKSGLKPLGCAVLVETYEPQKKGSVIVMPDAVKDRMVMMEQRAIVVAVGPEAWSEEREPRAKPGDHVLITKHAGYVAGADCTADGQTYRLVNDRDIFCAIEVT